ncbi:MAG: hypothetical protein WAQ52_02515 [Terriglobales bacterium]
MKPVVVPTMKAKTLGIIEEALVQGLREAGVSFRREERAFARKLTSDKTFQRLADSPDSAKDLFLNAMVAAFLVSCKKSPEPSPEKLNELLQQVPAIAYELRSSILKGVQQMAKQLPRKRGGGPKPRLATPAEKNQACAQIAALIGQRVKSSEAIARVARSARGGEGVSYRTMQRIWHGRPY